MIVVNDNGRSYMPTVGGLATHLDHAAHQPALRAGARPGQDAGSTSVPGVGPAVYDALHAMKKGMKDALAPQGIFEDLGLKYVGPIDGHDRVAVEQALAQAKKFGGPVIVHVITRKGFGYDPAERNEADQFHQIGAVRRRDRRGPPDGPDLDRLLLRGDGRARRRAPGHRRRSPRRCSTRSGLDRFAAAYPERIFDVGIAEQHAVTSAAGLAMGGMHPVVAIYATFLNRAFDQVLMDVALHQLRRHLRARPRRRHRRRRRQPQRHVGHVDPAGRARACGSPLRATAPGSRELLREAVAVDDAPTVRAPPQGRAARRHRGGRPGRRLRRARPPTAPRTCSSSASARWPSVGVEVGRPAGRPGHRRHRRRPALGQAGRPRARRAGPRPPAGRQRRGQRPGRRRAASVAPPAAQRRAACTTPFRLHGIPQEFLDHAKRDAILERIGLTAQTIARGIVERLAAEGHDPLSAEPVQRQH